MTLRRLLDESRIPIARESEVQRRVIQCKHRKDGWSGKPVGSPDLQVLNGTGRQVHHGDVVVMLTNGRITANAAQFAKSQRLHLVDRHLLAEWAGGSHPLWNSCTPSLLPAAERLPRGRHHL
ncbi:restriction endonuclease [Streptomyces spororaveus]|uniref:restriction endonuclease n=1 Tax=Streptomyces spororaveus TaxID=284039 RepID=UPI0019235F26